MCRDNQIAKSLTSEGVEEASIRTDILPPFDRHAYIVPHGSVLEFPHHGAVLHYSVPLYHKTADECNRSIFTPVQQLIMYIQVNTKQRLHKLLHIIRVRYIIWHLSGASRLVQYVHTCTAIYYPTHFDSRKGPNFYFSIDLVALLLPLRASVTQTGRIG